MFIVNNIYTYIDILTDVLLFIIILLNIISITISSSSSNSRVESSKLQCSFGDKKQ